MDIPTIHLVRTNHVDDSSLVMLDSVANYLRVKGNYDRIFIRTTQRNGSYVTKLLGNRPITSYATSEAAKFRDWYLEKGMSIKSVKRVFASVRSIINLNIREYGFDGANAVSGTYMPDDFDTPKREPIPNDILKVIQRACQTSNDEPRWLVALISNTGMRLSEAAGLSKDNVYLDEGVPYVDIKPQPWRRLKTAGSQRKLPLVGISLWAARQACTANNSLFLFSRYCDEKECYSNSASTALNKWLKQLAGPDYVIHSFRHSIRDKLRAVACPSDMIDQIVGWQSGKVDEEYRVGYDMLALKE